jgi:hypothetical protein
MPSFDSDREADAFFVGKVEWNGNIVDIFPCDGYSVSEMLECELSGPIDDIYDANDTSRFDDGEHLGYVYFDDEESYDLRVANQLGAKL